MPSYMELVNRAASDLTGNQVDFSDVGSALANRALLEAAEWSADKPVVKVNRARGAALVDSGYGVLAFYDRWRPTIFAISAGACTAALAMGYLRRKIPEGWIVYGFISLVTGTVAWFTRPDAFRPAPAPLPSSESSPGVSTPVAGLAGKNPPPEAPGALAQFLGWLDRRVEKLTGQRPGWEAQTYTRLSQDLGFGRMSPAVRILLTENSL